MPKRQRPVRKVEVNVFVHATEDEEKVKQALRNIIPEYIPLNLSSTNVEGYYGDPIRLLETEFHKWKTCTDILKNLFRNLSSLDQDKILREAQRRIDESGNLYLRLDKQEAFNKKLKLSDKDPIKIKFRFYIPHKEDPVEVIYEWLNRIEMGEMPEAYAP